MKENNTAKIEIELDCSSCPLQIDEAEDLRNKIFELIFKWNRGISVKSCEVYG